MVKPPGRAFWIWEVKKYPSPSILRKVAKMQKFRLGRGRAEWVTAITDEIKPNEYEIY